MVAVPRRLTAVDLFCGAGGLSVGIQDAGFEILLAVDSWPAAIASYRQNFSHPAVLADLAELDVHELRKLSELPEVVDLVVGGPPCQGFSIQRIGIDDDERNDLVGVFGEFVVALNASAFVMENVLGLLGARGKRQARQLEEQLTDAGYEVRRAVVNAAEYGAPQIRKRVVYYGWLPQRIGSFDLPLPTYSSGAFRTVWDAIGDLPAPATAGSRGPDPLHVESRLSDLNRQRLRHIPPGGGFESLPQELRVKAHRSGASVIGHRYVYGRLDPARPAATITGKFDSFTRGKFAHPFEDRNITLREGARLQTFDDDFKFFGSREDIAAQIGNAVPPLLARAIGRAVAEALRQIEHAPSQLRLPRRPAAAAS